MKKIFLVKKLSFLSLFIVFFFKILNFKIYVYKTSLITSKEWWFKFLSIEEVSFETSPLINTRPIFGHEGDNLDKVVDELIDEFSLKAFNKLFINVKNSEDKLRLLVKNYVLSSCKDIDRISIWINGNFHNSSEINTKVYFLGVTNKISKILLLKECNKVKIIPIFSSKIFYLSNFVFKIFKLFLRKFLNFFNKVSISKRIKSDYNFFSIMNRGLNTSIYPVLFFPHQSIFYGDLFKKDYFYSVDQNSVFHPSKILHVEFSNIMLDEQKAKFYSDNNIKTVLFPLASINTHYKSLIYLLNNIGLRKAIWLLKKNPVLFFALMIISLKFLSSRDIITNSYNANIVLMGYELNFPPIISLAFESLQVKTVAVQERFLPSAFYSNFGFIVDSYLCSSEFVKNKINMSRTKFANNSIPCGQVRTDLLVNLQKNINAPNKIFTIVAFDYYSEKDIYANQKQPLINWKGNIVFYKDLFRLAKNIPNIKIIIRGKDLEWTQNKYFQDILKNINGHSAIIVSSDYSTNAQYKISVEADLIIAKHTSICDELLAIGKQVIFHDYLPNSSKVISLEFDYNNTNIFANSYKELESMVKGVINQKSLLSDSEFYALQKIINNGLADGMVRQRIMSNINNLYQESLSVTE